MLTQLLIVGLGSIGRRHARLARQLVPGVEIIGWSRRAPEEHDLLVDRTVSTIEDALAAGPQAAVIARPASMHVAAALPLARAGVHLLVEKPIADTTVGVAELIDTARQRGSTLMTGYNLRFLASLNALRDAVQQGAIGRVLSVRAEAGQYLPSWRPTVDYRATASATAALGGGVLLELSHEIDYLRWVFGEIQSVNATLLKQSGLEIDVEDTAHLMLVFEPRSGATPLVASVTLDFVRHDFTRRCTVIGECGSLRWDAIADSVQIFEQGRDDWRSVFNGPRDRDESYAAEWRHFLECIEGRHPPLVPGEDGLAVLQVIEAARRSSATGAVLAAGA